jgi:cyclomaltodextrinase / maltogenic alpha-amylase / neopullulanase
MSASWFRNAVIYHILIDRFAGCTSAAWEEPGFCGGNLRAINAKIPYLAGLGIDAVYLSPFYAGTAYHGYHLTDFYSVDPRFGTETDFRELAAALHAAGLKLIIDFVPNHVSRQHPFFVKALEDPASPYRGWFFFNERTQAYRRFLDVDELPKLNLDHPGARAHVIRAALHWLALGADGLRIDHAVGPSRDFSRAFYAAVERARPDAVVFAEAWLEHPPLRFLPAVDIPHKYARALFRRLNLERLQRDCIGLFDGALDFAVRGLLLDCFARREWSPAVEAEFTRRLDRHYASYPDSFFLPAFIDNHDTNRFYFECGHDRERLLRALSRLLALPQPVILYYGTETGLSQERTIAGAVPYADLQARRVMNWESPDEDVLGKVKELIRLRRSGRPGF